MLRTMLVPLCYDAVHVVSLHKTAWGWLVASCDVAPQGRHSYGEMAARIVYIGHIVWHGDTAGEVNRWCGGSGAQSCGAIVWV